MRLRCLAALLLALPAGAEPAGRVVIVSLDGLRPEHYLGEGFKTPVLQRLAREGARAGEVETVFPPTTCPTHATLVTGVRPARHGISYDLVRDPFYQRTGRYTHASDLRVPALWNALRDAKGAGASLFWPGTVDAPLDWNLPDVDGIPDPSAALKRHATGGLLDALAPEAGAATKEALASPSLQDALAAKAAAWILKAKKPHLLLVRLVQAGAAQREHGRTHDAVASAVAWTDEALGVIVQGIADAGMEAETTLIVTGGHGYADCDRICAPTAVLREAGLIAGEKPTAAWLAVTHVAGAAAAVFVDAASPMPAAEVEKRFRAQAEFKGSAVYTILSREQLDGLKAMPGAAFGLVAEPGWTFTDDLRLRTPFLRSLGRTKGTAGATPTRPGMGTGLVLRGRRVKAGASIAAARLTDVAPTAAALLGIRLPDVEGRVLVEMLDP
jgi:predicted AlkP superfamily pyrophosphatase or phosphodiesterase